MFIHVYSILIGPTLYKPYLQYISVEVHKRCFISCAMMSNNSLLQHVLKFIPLCQIGFNLL